MEANKFSDWAAAIVLWEDFFAVMHRENRQPHRRDVLGFTKARLLRSDQLVQIGQPDAANTLVNAVLTETPRDVPALRRSAKLATLRRDWPAAAERWLSLIQAGLNSTDVKVSFVRAYRNWVMELTNSGQLKTADTVCREVLDQLPDLTLFPDLPIELSMARGDWVEAERRLCECLEQGDPGPAVFEKLSDVSCRLGKFGVGEALLRSGLEREPLNQNLRRKLENFTQFKATALPIWGRRSDWAPGDDRRIATWSQGRPQDGRMSVLFAGDTSLRSNWGCRATTTALRTLIHSRSARIDFTVDVAQWGTYFAEIAPEGYAPQEPKDLERLAEVVRSQPNTPISNALRGCDVVILNGEGAFLDFARAGRLLLALAYIAHTVFRKPCILVNHTSDLRDPRLSAIAEVVYPLLDDVAFREPVSMAHSGRIRSNLNLPQTFAADAIHTCGLSSDAAWREMCERGGYFAYHPDALQMFDPRLPYIVLGGSARWRFQPRREHDSASDYAVLGRALLRLARVVVVAIEHQEEPYLRAVAEEISAPFVGCRLPIPQAIDLVAHSALYVGGRWHTTIKGLMGGVPPILLSTNSAYKTTGLLQLYGLHQPEVDFYDVGKMVQTITGLAEDRMGAGQNERERIREVADEMALSAYDNVRWLPKVEN